MSFVSLCCYYFTNIIYEILGNDKVFNHIFFTRDQTHIRSIIKHILKKLWRKTHKKNCLCLLGINWKVWLFHGKTEFLFTFKHIYKIHFLRVNMLLRLCYSSNTSIFDKKIQDFIKTWNVYLFHKKNTHIWGHYVNATIIYLIYLFMYKINLN